MALINCPECGKEVSDKAKLCMNCGYKIPHPEKKEQLKKCIAFAGIFVVAIILVVIIYSVATKVHTPFEKIKRGMTSKNIHKIFGKPDDMNDVNDTDRFDIYYNTKFLGLKGKVIVYYDSDGEEIIDCIYWYYHVKDEETLSDYSGFIDKAIEFFTEEYGTTETSDGMTFWSWLDSVGGDYSLHLLDHSAIPSVDSLIMLRYKP